MSVSHDDTLVGDGTPFQPLGLSIDPQTLELTEDNELSVNAGAYDPCICTEPPLSGTGDVYDPIELNYSKTDFIEINGVLYLNLSDNGTIASAIKKVEELELRIKQLTDKISKLESKL